MQMVHETLRLSSPTTSSLPLLTTVIVGAAAHSLTNQSELQTTYDIHSGALEVTCADPTNTRGTTLQASIAVYWQHSESSHRTQWPRQPSYLLPECNHHTSNTAATSHITNGYDAGELLCTKLDVCTQLAVCQQNDAMESQVAAVDALRLPQLECHSVFGADYISSSKQSTWYFMERSSVHDMSLEGIVTKVVEGNDKEPVKSATHMRYLSEWQACDSLSDAASNGPCDSGALTTLEVSQQSTAVTCSVSDNSSTSTLPVAATLQILQQLYSQASSNVIAKGHLKSPSCSSVAQSGLSLLVLAALLRCASNELHTANIKVEGLDAASGGAYADSNHNKHNTGSYGVWQQGGAIGVHKLLAAETSSQPPPQSPSFKQLPRYWGITGGTGGLGVLIANWLSLFNLNKLALLGRSGKLAKTDEQLLHSDWLKLVM